MNRLKVLTGPHDSLNRNDFKNQNTLGSVPVCTLELLMKI